MPNQLASSCLISSTSIVLVLHSYKLLDLPQSLMFYILQLSAHIDHWWILDSPSASWKLGPFVLWLELCRGADWISAELIQPLPSISDICSVASAFFWPGYSKLECCFLILAIKISLFFKVLSSSIIFLHLFNWMSLASWPHKDNNMDRVGTWYYHLALCIYIYYI